MEGKSTQCFQQSWAEEKPLLGPRRRASRGQGKAHRAGAGPASAVVAEVSAEVSAEVPQLDSVRSFSAIWPFALLKLNGGSTPVNLTCKLLMCS